MRKSLLCILFLIPAYLFAQYNNAWIDYSKTYYKFKVSKDNLYRIPQSALAAAGIGAVNADHYQLWRNGVQVRLHTTQQNTALAADGYLEFWGLMNDGAADSTLYRVPGYQLNKKYSLESDTSTYFLTVNPAGNNLRYNTVANVPLTGTPDAYFMNTITRAYKNQLSGGYGTVASTAGGLNVYVFSSSYDNGEGWVSQTYTPAASLNELFSNLNLFTGGPQTYSLSTGIQGMSDNSRNMQILVNNNALANSTIYGLSSYVYSGNNLPISQLSENTTVTVKSNTTVTTDKFVAAQITLTYPSTFNFNNQNNFAFELPASASGNKLRIQNFNYGSTQPVLLDNTTGNRYLGNISSAPGTIEFVLPPSSQARKFILASNDDNYVLKINSLQSKTFLNYAAASSLGNYLIISHPALFNGTNSVEQYRQYRSSAAGGSFTAKIFDVTELYDQFAFGIQQHPEAVRNFISFANSTVSGGVKNVFIIGHGMQYQSFRASENMPETKQLALVPTFGSPASDNLLASPPGKANISIPIGRLSAVKDAEVALYLNKVKEYEQVLNTQSPVIAEKIWRKNVVHLSGELLPNENFLYPLNIFKYIIEDTLFGAKVETFRKSSSGYTEVASGERVRQLIESGLAMVTYFGHASTTNFAFNLNNPEYYNNNKKYFFFNASGCDAGDFFVYEPSRLNSVQNAIEKWVFAADRGSIGVLSNTHFGSEDKLTYYDSIFYQQVSRKLYGSTIGEQIKRTTEVMGGNDPALDYSTRIHLEEINLACDPAIKLYYSPKPDYAIEEPYVKVSPGVVSLASGRFSLDVKYFNIGHAKKDSINILVSRKLPNNSVQVLYNRRVPAPYYADSFHLDVNINPLTDRGNNEFTIRLDNTNRVDELYETNNSITKSIYIFDNDIKPVFPYDFSIIGKQDITFSASTANPIIGVNQYLFEIDTTELFNSPLKKTASVTGVGGLQEFRPGMVFRDSTVYYWRVGIAATNGNPQIWNGFSFIYIANAAPGFNQSHYYQHLKSAGDSILMAANRLWEFGKDSALIVVKNGVFPTASNQAEDFEVQINFDNSNQSVCGVSGIIISAYDPVSFRPMQNNYGTVPANSPGLYGSDPVCGPTRNYNFQYNILDQAKRISAVNFLDMIPDGYIVVVRNISGTNPASNTYADTWKLDSMVMGAGNSLYRRLRNAGFADIDSFNRPRAFNFIYKKNDASFTPVWTFSTGIYDKIVTNATAQGSLSKGTITSPAFGPAKNWQTFKWNGYSRDAVNNDNISYQVIGIENSGNEVQLRSFDSTQRSYDVSSISAQQYPYLKLRMRNADPVKGTPYQLRYWMLNYQPVAEGAVAPNLLLNLPDTVNVQGNMEFALAFKNVSLYDFDSMMRVKLSIVNSANVTIPLAVSPQKVLVAGDTIQLRYSIPVSQYTGINTLVVEFNPDNHQPEQYHYNNILYKTFNVIDDNIKPVLDVTFDGVHILDKDIVSSTPHILIKLTDENKFLALADTSLMQVSLLRPDGSTRRYYFRNNDTLRFMPADLSSGKNVATVEFNPALLEDGEYTLIVTGKDARGNAAGTTEYRTTFTVYNKPMISDMLNYPNPFTTSTAFVFTLTGSKVPENIRIQIMTVTGKIVREINSVELGPVHIGRNITDFKWDGTDQYGQALANGVYLYRVITSLDGKKMDKFDKINIDKYFNKGYGKMYLMR